MCSWTERVCSARAGSGIMVVSAVWLARRSLGGSTHWYRRPQGPRLTLLRARRKGRGAVTAIARPAKDATLYRLPMQEATYYGYMALRAAARSVCGGRAPMRRWAMFKLSLATE